MNPTLKKLPDKWERQRLEGAYFSMNRAIVEVTGTNEGSILGWKVKDFLEELISGLLYQIRVE